MVTTVSDPRSSANDQIAHAATVLRRSEKLQTLFEAVCRGGPKPKTVAKLMAVTGYSQVNVLQLGRRLADQHLVVATKVDKVTAYAKDRFYTDNRAKILRYARDSAKLAALPTKVSPRPKIGGHLKIVVRGGGVKVRIEEITCDDLDQFDKVKKVKVAPALTISERKFKQGIQKIVGEIGKFTDWGGEGNDLFTSRVKFKGKRTSVAFAFKGPGTKGTLTPGKLGKNGDQIQRLFLAPAEIFIVQYHSQIAQSVLEQMKAFATLNSVREGKKVWYGVIDGDDTNRLLAAYKRQFGLT